MAVYRNVAANTITTVGGRTSIVREELNPVKLELAPQQPEPYVDNGDAVAASAYIAKLSLYIQQLREFIVKLQQQLQQTTMLANSNKSNGAITIKDVSIILGDTDVAHRLGRAYTGWRISRLRGAQTVYEATTQPDNTKFLRLTGTGTATVDVEVW